MALLFGIGGLIVFILWPYHQYTFRFNPEDLLDQYVDGDRPTTMSAMRRALALRIKADMAGKWRIIQRLRLALQIALVFLLLDILAWLLASGHLITSQGAPASVAHHTCVLGNGQDLKFARP
ncbi:hypothetical protein NKI32_02590 [Mesorhizobium sp. M0761]|uniref:hypothetical protein n=1 Tax=Mesorhizobium sp. M0761 TaxID=2956994 RepID=UPI00333AD807